MIYYGPHTKIDYDHLVFEPVDEIMIMQQHCGGQNRIVYKNNEFILSECFDTIQP